MKNLMSLESKELISTIEFRDVINELRVQEGENKIRNNDFINRVCDELELDKSSCENFVSASGGTPQAYFMLTEDEALQVGMRESKGVRKGVIAWIKERKKPKSQLERMALAVIEAGEIIQGLEQKNLQLEEKIEKDAPKVVLAEALLESDSGIRITEFARASSDTYGLGRNKMYAKLREWKILDYKNQPYQRCIDAGWFFTVERPFTNGDFSGINIQVFITGKGQKYVVNRLIKEHIIEEVIINEENI